MFGRLFGRSASQQPKTDVPAVAANKHRVLVVDDDSHLREMVRLALEQRGYAVQVGGDGHDAVNMARDNPPDLIVLDGNMPVLDGFDALKKLRSMRATQNIPVIMLTMRSHHVDMITGYRFGAQEYLTKPIAIEQLLANVKKLLQAR